MIKQIETNSIRSEKVIQGQKCLVGFRKQTLYPKTYSIGKNLITATSTVSPLCLSFLKIISTFQEQESSSPGPGENAVFRQWGSRQERRQSGGEGAILTQLAHLGLPEGCPGACDHPECTDRWTRGEQRGRWKGDCYVTAENAGWAQP